MYEVTLNRDINFGAIGINEILQNVSMIISTTKGSVPLDRNFGIDSSLLDLPIEVAQNLFSASIMEAVQEYEPRVTIKSVTYKKSHIDGKLIPKVQVSINELE